MNSKIAHIVGQNLVTSVLHDYKQPLKSKYQSKKTQETLSQIFWLQK